MLNLRHLCKPSPNDANLNTKNHSLGVFLNTNSEYYHNINRKNNMFNKFHDFSPNRKGGILPLDLPNGIQPFKNVLTAPLVIPKVNKLIDFQPVPTNELVSPTVSRSLRV